MTIVEALKTKNLRISNGERWMLFEEGTGWVVMQLDNRRHVGNPIVETSSESKAIAYLLYGTDK
jgi:hypothetical protein